MVAVNIEMLKHNDHHASLFLEHSKLSHADHEQVWELELLIEEFLLFSLSI